MGSNIYDKTYGNVYIVAGDSSLPFGSIVRIKNLKYFDGKDIYAMVLDRGGGVGFNKNVTFDLLFPDSVSESNFGIERNILFEILRYGY